MKKIQELRKELNITQTELARQLGISQSCIAMWESGKSVPRLSNLIKLSSVLKCEISDLIIN